MTGASSPHGSSPEGKHLLPGLFSETPENCFTTWLMQQTQPCLLFIRNVAHRLPAACLVLIPTGGPDVADAKKQLCSHSSLGWCIAMLGSAGNMGASGLCQLSGEVGTQPSICWSLGWAWITAPGMDAYGERRRACECCGLWRGRLCHRNFP